MVTEQQIKGMMVVLVMKEHFFLVEEVEVLVKLDFLVPHRG
jgi:hypothetical protein